MILVGNHICYSPYPPQRYLFDGLGHGNLFKDRLGAWNLAWLSFPVLDRYLEPYQAGAIAAIGNELGKLPMLLTTYHRGEIPELPYWLTLEPGEFLEEFEYSGWEYTHAGRFFGPTWLDMLRSRVRESQQQPLPTYPFILCRDGNHTLTIATPFIKEVAK
jgi:hypothetical protein